MSESEDNAAWNAKRFDQQCLLEYGRTLHGGHAHYCNEWDGLPIDDTMPEFDACTCYNETDE